MENYWIVGAVLGGPTDPTDIFIRRGYWSLGWTDKEQPDQAKLRDEMKAGDRIAIKRMMGKRSENIQIRGLGIVQEIDHEDSRIYIQWVITTLHRKVSANGCVSAIHGPFPANDEWTREVFQI